MKITKEKEPGYIQIAGVYVYDTEPLFKKIESRLGVSKEEIQSKTRKKEIAFARQLFCYLLKDKMTRCEIAEIINRDHSTVTWHVRSIENYLKFHVSRKQIIKEML